MHRERRRYTGDTIASVENPAMEICTNTHVRKSQLACQSKCLSSACSSDGIRVRGYAYFDEESGWRYQEINVLIHNSSNFNTLRVVFRMNEILRIMKPAVYIRGFMYEER